MLTDTEQKCEKLVQWLQSPVTKSEGKCDNLKRYTNLPKALEEDLSALQTHFANYHTLEHALRDASEAEKEEAETKLNDAHKAIAQYINGQHQTLRSEWATFHARLTLKNKHTQKKLEALDAKKEAIEPWLQLLMVCTSIIDLSLALTLTFAPQLSPLTAVIYLTISAVSLICQIAMLNQLITTMFSYKPLNQKHKVLSESINTLNDALYFSEEEKTTASQQLEKENIPVKKDAHNLTFFDKKNGPNHMEKAPAPTLS